MSPPETIYVTTSAVDTAARPWSTANCERLRRAGVVYSGADFRLAEQPERADFILFVDSTERYLGDVYASSLFKRHKGRCYVHNATDNAVPVLPGLYPDVPSPVRCPGTQLGAFYLRCFDNQALLERHPGHEPNWLFSFAGNVANARPVRERIITLKHSRALLLDRSSGLRDDDLDYVTTLRDSAFVVCPKGLGPTSWRFYETMMAARVPVIVSDNWLPAREIRWEDFALQVPEAEIESIPSLCERNSHRAREMGSRAREEWERHCSITQAFGWVGRRLQEIRASRTQDQPSEGVEFLRDLLFRSEVPGYLRWRLGRALREAGLRGDGI